MALPSHGLFPGRVAIAIGLALTGVQPATADHSDEALHEVTDCRYLVTENPDLAFDSRHVGGVWFPQGGLFRPLLAELEDSFE